MKAPKVLKKLQLGSSVFALLAVSALAAACGSDSSDASGQDATSNTDVQQSEPLVIYANDFIDQMPVMFQGATGYAAEGVHYAGGELLARIEAEQANPQWDVLVMDGHGSIRSLGDRGLLLTDWEPENLGNLGAYGESVLPEDHAFFPIGIHAAAVIAYNTDIVSEVDAPKTWDEFIAYDGPVGHADPAVAAPAYPLVSALFDHWGLEDAKQKYEQRFSDGMKVYPKNPAVLEALLGGEIEVAALQEHNSYGAMLDGEPVGIIWPDEGAPGSLRVVAINKQSENLDVAKAFVEFLLRPETQNALVDLPTRDGFFTPLSTGTHVREERRQDGTFLLPDAAWSAEHEAEIKTWFADQSVQ